MRPDKPNVNDAIRVVHLYYQPVLIPADIEDHSVIADDARSTK